MKNINYRQSALLSIIFLFLEYLLIRYALIDLHKMKDWPTVLFASCFVVITVCFFMKKTVTPLMTSAAYVVGFVIAYIFQTNGVDAGRGTTNNLWIIWTIAVLVFMFIAIVIEVFLSRKSIRICRGNQYE